MIDNPKKSVFLTGTSSQVFGMFAGVVRQYGATARSFATAEECLKMLREQECTLLAIDVDDTATSGLHLIAESRKVCPQAATLVLVEHGDIPMAVKALKAGATDCLEKPIDEDRLPSTVERLLGPSQPASRHVKAHLTNTEVRVLHGILEGKTSKEVAERLHRSPRTVEVHRRNIIRKLGVSNLVDLVKQAAMMGFLSEEDKD